MSSDGEILVSPFSFTNDHTGFQLILSKLTAFEKDSLVIGMESTAHYGENLICFLFSRGFHLCVINAIQTATMRKTNIRKTKTDSFDTYIIIKALMMNQYRRFIKKRFRNLEIEKPVSFPPKAYQGQD